MLQVVRPGNWDRTSPDIPIPPLRVPVRLWDTGEGLAVQFATQLGRGAHNFGETVQ